MLTACSKGPAGPSASASPEIIPSRPAPAAAPAPRQRDSRPVIAAFGDSLTAGFGVDPDLSYPAFLQKELDRRGFNYNVVNLGISGDTSSGGVSRVNSVLELKPEIVILELGANDGLRGLPLASTRSNLSEMIETLRKGGAKVLLAGITLPPNYGPDYIRSFEKIYSDLAKQYAVPFLPFLLEGVATDRRLMQSDGLHPTAEGNRKVAMHVLESLESMLRKH